MRNAITQEVLDGLSDEKKREMTSFKELEKRGVVIERWDNWMFCNNEYPHEDRGTEQYILWAIDPRKNRALYDYEFSDIIKRIDIFGNGTLRIARHAKKEKSVGFREHFHVFVNIA